MGDEKYRVVALVLLQPFSTASEVLVKMLSLKLTPGLLALLLLSNSDAFTPTGLAAQRSQANPTSLFMVRHSEAFHLEWHGIF